MRISDPAQFGKVAVLLGGNSAEREVSLKSGAAVLAALQRRGVDAHPLDPADDAIGQLQRGGFARAFNILHGRGGEDGVMQAVLESLAIPYTGSGVLASALGMDKWRTKLIWQGAGLPVPDSVLLEETSDLAAVTETLGLPLFVKPACEGSSVGVTKVKAAAEIAAAFAAARRHDPLVLAERNIGGGEYTVTILDGEALPVIRIVPANEFYDYQAKYLQDDTEYRCPCGLKAEEERAVQALALQAFKVLGCCGWGRIDLLRDEAGRFYLLEANTVPGMTDHSLVPMAARAAGIDFDDLVWRILESSVGDDREGERAYG